jgi:hypothetical protein
MQLRGVAASRGAAWAERYWARCHARERSDAWRGTAAGAVLQIADLATGDLAERLAPHVLEGADRRWSELWEEARRR